jgi:hypothetical protein
MKLLGHLRRCTDRLKQKSQTHGSWRHPRDAFQRYEHLKVGADADLTSRDSRQGAGPKFLPADQIGDPTAAFARDHGIVGTSDRLAIPPAQDDAQVFRTEFVACAVFAALGLGWNSGLNWNYFLASAPSRSSKTSVRLRPSLLLGRTSGSLKEIGRQQQAHRTIGKSPLRRLEGVVLVRTHRKPRHQVPYPRAQRWRG